MNKAVIKGISPIIVVAMLGTAALIYFTLIASNGDVAEKQSLTQLSGTLADIGCKKDRQAHNLKITESPFWLSFVFDGIDCSVAIDDWKLGSQVNILYQGKLDQEPKIYDLNIAGKEIFSYQDSIDSGYEIQKNLFYFVLLQWFFVIALYVKGVVDARKSSSK